MRPWRRSEAVHGREFERKNRSAHTGSVAATSRLVTTPKVDMMPFQISALPREEFASLFALDDAQLRSMGARRYVADRTPGFPCRVSLKDAAVGERVVLVPFTHQSADSPYRASGPVFVREAAVQASLGANEVPEQLRLRLLSVKAYDADALMIDADVTDGRKLESVVERMLGDRRAQYLHVHFARPGCYACRIDRA
jgi:hypothetical protein